MKDLESIQIRLLELSDVDSWLEQCLSLDAESGKDSIYYGP